MKSLPGGQVWRFLLWDLVHRASHHDGILFSSLVIASLHDYDEVYTCQCECLFDILHTWILPRANLDFWFRLNQEGCLSVGRVCPSRCLRVAVRQANVV